jgi:hypothetical protein
MMSDYAEPLLIARKALATAEAAALNKLWPEFLAAMRIAQGAMDKLEIYGNRMAHP